MDQELLELVMESLRRVKDVSLIDQAFLQVGFLRKKGYDIVSVSELKALRAQQQKLATGILDLSIATDKLLELETKYHQLFEKQQLRILALEQEVAQLKNIRE